VTLTGTFLLFIVISALLSIEAGDNGISNTLKVFQMVVQVLLLGLEVGIEPSSLLGDSVLELGSLLGTGLLLKVLALGGALERADVGLEGLSSVNSVSDLVVVGFVLVGILDQLVDLSLGKPVFVSFNGNLLGLSGGKLLGLHVKN
jgi:hypothetical protein